MRAFAGGGECVFWQGPRFGAFGERDAIPIVLPARERPLPVILDHLVHQFELKDEPGGASRPPRERPTLEPPETIAGAAAFMAPERTVRMNPLIVSRSDLYSRVVALRQRLTASPPFTASDPMEWVYCQRGILR